ncbi:MULTISPECIES: thioredoxin [Mesorhizobium]|uniref:Thioredoxin n=1 Tax=Mesorhizobium denitrificans TaxID=2294114 RepID=A0A371XGV7_9HYPH|nr:MULTISPECIES: thioredoxin [Mesorhizobium]RFC68462.1 thioredoxin [Mesorhizobium denitrificans]
MSGQDRSYGAGSGYTMNAPQYTTNVQSTPAQSAPTPSVGTPGDLIKDTTTAGFTADVIQESRNQPVLVDFWAPWCGPCKQLTPVLEKAVLAARGAVKLVKMNIDDHPSVAGQLGIQSIPAVIAFKNGQPVDGFMGAVPESQIDAFIKKLGGDSAKAELEEALAAATEARAAGDTETASQIYQMILQQDPESVDALAGLGEILFDAKDVEGLKKLLESVPPAKSDAAPIAALRARLALSEEAESLGDASALEQRLAENPKDHQARFDLALIQNAHGEREAAADNLLAIFKADRTWNDDGARAQLLKLFEAWGPTDDATLSARRKLSSILFS